MLLIEMLRQLFSKKGVSCPACGALLPREAQRCPRCGRQVAVPRARPQSSVSGGRGDVGSSQAPSGAATHGPGDPRH
jgi:ribosomal protein L40E